MRNACIVLVVVVLLSGCVAMGKEVKPEQVTQFKPDETTMDQVLVKLGPPSMRTKKSDGTTVLEYSYLRFQQNPASFIPFVGIFAGSGDTYQSSAVLTFNVNGTLKEYNTSEGGDGLGMGVKSGSIRDSRGGPVEAK